MNSWSNEFNSRFLDHFERLQVPPSRLNEALLYALKSPGKRLRPLFATEAAKLIDLDPKAAELFSYSIELSHLFSLVHDDLPCMDDDDLRRGLPTLHKKFDEATALLAGDSLLSLAFETFSQIESSSNILASSFNRALRFFSSAVGPTGMMGGQALEMETLAKNQDLSLEELIHIQDLKTGALFRASILTPLILKGIPESDSIFIDAKTYATDFGFAFQIADDLDDEVQDQKQSSKNILSLLGKKTAIEMAVKKITQNRLHSHFSASSILIDKLKSNS